MLNNYILPFLARGFRNENAITALINLGTPPRPRGFGSEEVDIHNCLAVNPFLSTAQIDRLYEVAGDAIKALLASRLDLNEEQMFKLIATRDPILRQAVLTKPVLWSYRNRFSDDLVCRILTESHLNTLEAELLLDLMSDTHHRRGHLEDNVALLRTCPTRIDDLDRAAFNSSRHTLSMIKSKNHFEEYLDSSRRTLSMIKSKNHFEEYLAAPWPDRKSELDKRSSVTDYNPLEMGTIRFTPFSESIGWPNQSAIASYQIEEVVGDASEELFTVLFELLCGWDAPGTLLQALEVALSLVSHPINV